MARLTEDTFSRGLETARLLLTSPRFSTTLAAAIRRPGGVDRAIDALLREFELDDRSPASNQRSSEDQERHLEMLLRVRQTKRELDLKHEAALRNRFGGPCIRCESVVRPNDDVCRTCGTKQQ